MKGKIGFIDLSEDDNARTKAMKLAIIVSFIPNSMPMSLPGHRRVSAQVVYPEQVLVYYVYSDAFFVINNWNEVTFRSLN